MISWYTRTAFAMLLAGVVVLPALAQPGQSGFVVSAAAGHATSPPVRSMPVILEETANHEVPMRAIPVATGPDQADPVVQSSSAGPLVAATGGLNIAGVGNGDYGFRP